MNYQDAVLLGVVQGVTEFLPVSSSGHLVLVQGLLRITTGSLLIDIGLHGGTLLAVIIIFRREITELLAGLKTIMTMPLLCQKDPSSRLFIMLLVGTLPAAFAGVLFKSFFERLFTSSTDVAYALLATGAFLAATKFFREGKKTIFSVGLFEAIMIGLAQAVAIIPGISRSGATICMAIFLGLEGRSAWRFSFLLFIPAAAGALLLMFKGLPSTNIELAPVALGSLVAFGTGILSLLILGKAVEKRKLHYFAPYCLLLAGIVLITTAFWES